MVYVYTGAQRFVKRCCIGFIAVCLGQGQKCSRMAHGIDPINLSRFVGANLAANCLVQGPRKLPESSRKRRRKQRVNEHVYREYL